MAGRQPGREAEAEAAWREAAAAGDPDALHGLAEWLAEQPGRQAEAEETSGRRPPPATG